MPHLHPSLRTGPARAAACAMLAIAAAWLALDTPAARGCGGTPPPFFCGIAYNFAMGGILNVVAGDEDRAVTVSTFHYLALIGFPPDACPPPPYSVTIQIDLGAGLGTQTFGPFPIDEGPNTIPIDVVIPGGPPRELTLNATADLALLSSGQTLRQTGQQPLCVVPGTGDTPDIEIRRASEASDDVIPFAPGGQAYVAYDIRNNTDEDYPALIALCSQNAADLAEVIAGQQDFFSNAFSISDPVGDAFEVGFYDDLDNGCFPKSSVPPHERIESTASKAMMIQAGDTKRILISFKAPGPCNDGKCDSSTIRVSRATADGMTPDACAGVVPVVSHAREPGNCPPSGRAAMASAGGDAMGAGVRLTSPIPGQFWQYDVNFDATQSVLLVDGEKRAYTIFTVFQGSDGQLGRNIFDVSFIDPPGMPDSIFQATYKLKVKAAPGSESLIAPQVTGVEVVDGAPTGFPNAPFLKVNTFVQALDGVDSTNTEAIHQVQAIIVTETFDFIRADINSIDTTVTSDGYFINISGAAPVGSTTESIIGFSLESDLRTFVEDPTAFTGVRGDMNGDGVVDGFDMDPFVLAAENPDAYVAGYPEGDLRAGDFNGDGEVDAFDIDPFLAAVFD